MKKLPIITALEEELAKITRELRVDVPKALREAAAHGDLSENAEYDAAKQRQTFLDARASHLSARINTLVSIKLDDIPKDKVAFGSIVELEDQDSGDVVTYELVTPDEVEPRIGKISVSSPIGKALMHKSVEDEVTIALPTGTKEYAVTNLKTLHDILAEEG